MSEKKLETKNTTTTESVEELEKKLAKVKAEREEKKKLRRAAIENVGALHLDEIYKRPGFRQRLVNLTPGNFEKQIDKGFSPIKAIPGYGCGNGVVNESVSPDGHLMVEVGRGNGSLKAIWMEIAEEDALILDEIRDDLAKEQARMIYESDVPEHVRVGKVTMED